MTCSIDQMKAPHSHSVHSRSHDVLSRHLFDTISPHTGHTVLYCSYERLTTARMNTLAFPHSTNYTTILHELPVLPLKIASADHKEEQVCYTAHSLM